MPVPFRDLRDDDDLGLAGYLRFVDEPDGHGMRGALFLLTARGEPIEFSFCRTDITTPFLWPAGSARRQAVAALVAALFGACAGTPILLLARADEVHPRLLTEDLHVDVPLCRVAEGGVDRSPDGESLETLTGVVQLFWQGQAPATESVARRLLAALVAHQLLLEPFERAALGLEEAFSA